MKKRIALKTLLLCLFVFWRAWGIYPQKAVDETAREAKNKKTVITVMGSSIAAGWVTSYKKQYDMQNGYAYRLGRFLEPRGYTVNNISVPGANTKKILKRLEEKFFPMNPDFVVIGLSLGNEGIRRGNPQQVMDRFFSGIREIAEKCKAKGIIPVLGSCYSSDLFNEEHYSYVKQMNLRLHSLNLPMINFLGALDDGKGKFPKGTTYDHSHPMSRGHEELFYTVVPGLFDALRKGKKMPVWVNAKGFLRVTGKNKKPAASFVPTDEIHSFSFGFLFRTKQDGVIAGIDTGQGIHRLEIKNNRLIYGAGDSKKIETTHLTPGRQWHGVVLVHRYLNGQTLLFLDGKPAGKLNERFIVRHLFLGGASNGQVVDYRQLSVYRSALNRDEVKFLEQWNLPRASLEVYAPLNLETGNCWGNNRPGEKKIAPNLARSWSVVTLFPGNTGKLIEILEEKIKEAQVKRENEIQFPEKQPIRLDRGTIKKYAGTYEVKPGDEMRVLVKQNRVFFVDRGREEEIFPESETVFFVKTPKPVVKALFEMNKAGIPHIFRITVNGKVVVKATRKAL